MKMRQWWKDFSRLIDLLTGLTWKIGAIAAFLHVFWGVGFWNDLLWLGVAGGLSCYADKLFERSE